MVTPETSETGRRITSSFVRSPVNNFMPTVLIVEDDLDNRLLLKMLLETWNYRVIEAADGVEALRLAEQIFPDLILMDVKMPLLDGLETTREIRASAKIGNVPVIFISGCAEDKYRQAADDVGANGYLVKPFNFDTLQSVIGEYITFDKML